MLKELFLNVLDMSIKGGYVILIVLLARLLLKRSPKIYSYLLWAVVLFRLICPFSFETVLSLVPGEADKVATNLYNGTNVVVMGGNIGNTYLPTAINLEAVSSVSSFDLLTASSYIWLAGIVLLLAKNIITLYKFSSKLKDAAILKENIYVSENLDTAFVLGFISPKIYLPGNLTEEEMEYVILHEKTHIRRFDHIIKAVSFLTLCIHWFNPLAWLAFFLCSEDMEMSCDEDVISKMGGSIKKDYSRSLLALATGRRSVRGTPLAFGEGNIKKRIQNVLKYKKLPMGVLMVIVVIVALLIYALMTDRKTEEAPAIWGVDAVIEEIDREEKTILAKVESENIQLYPEVLVSYDERTSFHYVAGEDVPDIIGLTEFDFNAGDEVQLFLDNIFYGEEGKANIAYAETVQASGKLLDELKKPLEVKNVEVSFQSLNDHSAFLEFNLPSDWQYTNKKTAHPEADSFDKLTVNERHYIVNNRNKIIGAFGINIFDEADSLAEIFKNLNAAGGHIFDTKDAYRVIDGDDTTRKAVTVVLSNENPAILIYNKDIMYTAAFEFDASQISDRDLHLIAESLKLKSPVEKEAEQLNKSFAHAYDRLKTDSKSDLENKLNELIKSHKNGTFEPVPNHNEAWPKDFPSPSNLPDEVTDDDYVVYYEEAVANDADTLIYTALNVWLHIKGDYWYVLEPAWLGQSDGSEVLSLSQGGFYKGKVPFVYTQI